MPVSSPWLRGEGYYSWPATGNQEGIKGKFHGLSSLRTKYPCSVNIRISWWLSEYKLCRCMLWSSDAQTKWHTCDVLWKIRSRFPDFVISKYWPPKKVHLAPSIDLPCEGVTCCSCMLHVRWGPGFALWTIYLSALDNVHIFKKRRWCSRFWEQRTWVGT